MLLYDSAVSGNCYKVRQLFAHLGIEYERREVDVIDRSGRLELLGALNPALRVPTLVFDDGRSMGESDAIMFYFAEGTPYLPERPVRARARAPVAVLRAVQPRAEHRGGAVLGNRRDHAFRRRRRGQATRRHRRAGGDGAAPRRSATFLVGERYTIADIALYAYTHVAPEAGFDLTGTPRSMPGSRA